MFKFSCPRANAQPGSVSNCKKLRTLPHPDLTIGFHIREENADSGCLFINI